MHRRRKGEDDIYAGVRVVESRPGQEADPVEPRDGSIADEAPSSFGILVTDFQAELGRQVVGHLGRSRAHGAHNKDLADVRGSKGWPEDNYGRRKEALEATRRQGRCQPRQPLRALETHVKVGVMERKRQNDEERNANKGLEFHNSFP